MKLWFNPDYHINVLLKMFYVNVMNSSKSKPTQ